MTGKHKLCPFHGHPQSKSGHPLSEPGFVGFQDLKSSESQNPVNRGSDDFLLSLSPVNPPENEAIVN